MDLRDEFKKNLKVYFAQNLFKFENITLDQIQTKNLLNSKVMDHLNFTLDDAQIIKNVFTAFEMLEHLDLDKIKIDEDIYVKLNEILARDQALFTGFFRNSNVYIDCIPDPIAPPDLNKMSYYLKMLNEINESSLKEVVPIVFCNLARMQPFFDGNKRSTLFLCNLALLKKDLGMFFIPMIL